MTNAIKLRYRVVSFTAEGEQWFTLVSEWLDEYGRVFQDSRQQMDAATFRGLLLEVTRAAKEVT